MIRVSKTLFIAASTLILGGTALADEPEGDGTDGSEGGGEAAAAAPTVGVSASAGGFSPDGWPQQIIDRSLVMKKGMIRAQADLGIVRLSVTLPPIPPSTTPTTESTTGSTLTVGGGFGVSDQIEVGGSYGIALKDFEAKGPFSLYGLYSLKNEQQVRLAAGGSMTYHIGAETFGLNLGAAFQYHLGEKMMIFSPASQLSIPLSPNAGAAIDLPVGFGIQATPNVFASLQTSLATIGLSPSGSAFLFADRTPIALSGFYSPSNTMDFGVTISAIDVGSFADVFQFIFTARIFAGSVPGGGKAPMTAVTMR